jgi:hypothetical protein
MNEQICCSRGKGDKFGSVRFIWCDVFGREKRVI